MKKMFLLALCLCSFWCLSATAFTHSFVQGHIHVVVHDSMYHDSATCFSMSNLTYTVTIDSSYTNDSVQFVDTTSGSLVFGRFVNTAGTSPWIFTTSQGMGWGDFSIPVGGGYLHSNSVPIKVTTPLDTLRYITFDDSIWVSPCLYGRVSGDIYIDNNSNCVFDAGDVGINEYSINIIDTLFGSIPYIDCSTGLMSAGYGYFPYSSPVQKSWMTNYSVSLPSWFSFIFPMSSCYTGPYTFTTLPQTNVDFPLQCSANVDVQCYALSADRVRLHTPFFVHPYVTNIGCDTVSGTMTMIKDSRITYSASLSSFPADTVRGDTLIWIYSHLSNVSSGAYWNSFFSDVYFTPDTTLVAGDTLCFQVYTNIPSADINPANNGYAICLPVRYSYDPNSKSAMPAAVDAAGTLPAGTHTLTYTINFQNTGTDAAYDVKIIDTLDSHLDPQSLKILGTSAHMIPKWLTPNIVEFDFNNIMLPDSNTNEPGSHGQVRFSIDIKPGVAAGTAINNTGYIYFDINPAVVTNTQHNVTSSPFAVPVVSPVLRMKIYPNPTTDQLVIENAGTGDLTVLNMNGVVLLSQPTTGDKTVLDISRLPSGIYLLKATNVNTSSVTKFTKY